MKKILLLLAVLVGMISCQVIKPEDRYIKLADDEEEGERNVVLIDFTGWKCPNCPEAAKVANALTSTYGSHVIVVSMHPKGMSFTEPGATGPDFATQEAMDYLKAFGGSNSLPTGVVDAQKYSGSYFLDYQQWAAAVTERLKVDVNYSMEMTANSTTCTVDLARYASDGRKVNLVLWLLEDSIIAPQSTTSSEIHDYAHRHVFRKCLNGSDIWGEEVDFSYDEASVTAQYQLPELEGKGFVIVAVAIDAETHEVLQAEEVELKQQGEGSFELVFEGDTLQDGDTIDVYKVNHDAGEVEFDGSIISTYLDKHDFTITETRYFDYSEYIVSMCIEYCHMDNPDHPGYWDCTIKGLAEQAFQAHIAIPEEKRGDTILLETDYAFSDGVTTKTIRVRFHYAPEESIE